MVGESPLPHDLCCVLVHSPKSLPCQCQSHCQTQTKDKVLHQLVQDDRLVSDMKVAWSNQSLINHSLQLSLSSTCTRWSVLDCSGISPSWSHGMRTWWWCWVRLPPWDCISNWSLTSERWLSARVGCVVCARFMFVARITTVSGWTCASTLTTSTSSWWVTEFSWIMINQL